MAAEEIERPEGMFRELLYIHTMLRRDLEIVRRLALQTRDGLSPETIVAEIRNLESTSPLWQLKFGCFHYCRFVHGHHTLEDQALFPIVKQQRPELVGVVDKLQEDHRRVHSITEKVVETANRVPGDATGISRFQLVEALEELESVLLEHLALEEKSIGPLLSTWTEWPLE